MLKNQKSGGYALISLPISVCCCMEGISILLQGYLHVTPSIIAIYKLL